MKKILSCFFLVYLSFFPIVNKKCLRSRTYLVLLLNHQGINKALKEGYFTTKDLVGLLQEYEHRLEVSSNLARESKLEYDKVKSILGDVVQKTANIYKYTGNNLKLQRDLSSVQTDLDLTE